ncbi:MAG TPA: TIM barrel protein [Chthonomonadaceae bacterium]|nr:TIM barrel protein [Chthonomonadaceae bacterium]
MPIPNTSRLSVSTFSLHRVLGVNYRDLPGDDGARPCTVVYGQPTCTLLDLPDRIADAGIFTLEISHPHLPSRETGYLEELRGRIREAGVTLLSLLIEAGDVTDPEHGERDQEWIAGWLETAGKLGAQRARVIAGKQPYTRESLHRSTEAMRALAAVAAEHGVRLTTENWFALLCCPEAVKSLLDALGGSVGFNLDFGNWSGPTKYNDLAVIFPYAESIHAKCAFSAGYAPDGADFLRCLELARAAAFRGPFTLIYDGPDDDEWKGLAIEREFVLPFL